jgi:hypothetical protein
MSEGYHGYYESCPGRGAARFAMHRRGGTQKYTFSTDPVSAAHRYAVLIRGHVGDTAF